MKNLGHKVHFMRMRRGLTLEQMSELTSVSSVTIHNIERGVHEPKVSTLLDICKALDLPLSFFLDDAENWLFHHVSAENPPRRAPSKLKKTWRPLPQFERLEITKGKREIVTGEAGELISLYLVFGRLEVADNRHHARMLAGDVLHFEPLAETEIDAVESSLVLLMRNLPGLPSR